MPSADHEMANNRAANDSDSDELDHSDEEGAITVDGIYIPPPPVPYCSIDNKGPRLIITQITNTFFKSYANKIILGPFHKSFNSIIGPNGSGKSNVIDSMLFVFGYRANKIRSKKLSVLLHNSKSFTNVQSATVSVHFAQIIDKSEDDYDVLPGSEFIVSRTVNKDNSSFYTIGNKKVQFKEVSQLLKGHGIDLKYNRFLILQGEVEQIAMMPPKGSGTEAGMLEYLEDIIGTTRYKEPLIKLSEKVEEYSEVRTEKLNRLKIVTEEVEILKEPMQEAVEFLKLENLISVKKNILYQYNISAIKENSKEVVEKKEEVDKLTTALMEKLNNVLQQKKEKELKLSEAVKAHEVMEKRRDAMKEAYERANNQHQQLALEMQQVNKDRHKSKDLLHAEKKKLEEYQRQPQETEEKIADCQKAIEKLLPKIEELQEEKVQVLASMKDLTKDLQVKKDKLTEQLTTLMEAVTETKTAYTLAENDLKMLTSGSDKEKSKLEQLQKSYEDIKARIEQLTDETNKLKSLIPAKDKELQKANQELPTIKKQEADLLNKLRGARSKVEESKASMNASKSKSRVLDALMQQKREGKCPGLFGRLGDLGAIESKYDVAISTACGPLDNIVVDTVDTGQWCIDFLKRNDIGRVTIIVLEKQEHLIDLCNRDINTPEDVPRLFDLIHIPDERIRPAFYYALRDTLVAENLDQASRIAYGAHRFRVVTLKGDLIETTGAMSGGGNRVLRGRMGQSVTVEVDPQEIEAMEEEMNQQETVIRQLRQRQSVLENQIAMVNPEVKQMKIAFEKMNIELDGLKKREPAVAAQLKEQSQKIKRLSLDLGKVKKMEAEVNTKKNAFDKASEKANVIQEQVDALTREIKEKTQGKIQTIDKKLKEHNKNVDKIKNEITKLSVAVKTAERNAVKSEKTIVTLQEDIENAEKKLLEMKDRRAEIEEDAAKLLKLVEEITAGIEDGATDYDDLKADVKQLTKVVNEFKSEKIELDQKVKTLQDELNVVQEKITALRLKISHLKLQEIPEEEPEVLKEYTEEELVQINMEEIMQELKGLEVQIKASQPNLGAIDEYRKKMKVVIARSNELDVVVQKWKKVREMYDNLRGRRRDEFMTGFRIIKSKLKEMYQMITIGGDADFELVDTYDPFSEGIQFSVRPPKKTWKIISNLSGGEKTLSSLALVFALHYYKPSPLYVMDEIDAALDFKNVSIIGNYIKERTKNAQFIIISLRSNMFELACHLIGIFKTNDCTKSVTIDPRTYDEAKKEEKLTQNGEQPESQDLFSQLVEPNNKQPENGSGSSTDIICSSDSVPASGNLNQVVPQEVESSHIPTLPPLSQDLFASQETNENNVSSDIILGTQEEPMEVDD